MRERDILRLENQYLREQIEKTSKGKIVMPKPDNFKKKDLPPLSKGNKEASNKPMSLQKLEKSNLKNDNSYAELSKKKEKSDLNNLNIKNDLKN